MIATPNRLQPGTRIEVTQRAVSGGQVRTFTVTGTVLTHEPEPTGSWYAHDKHGRLTLDRLRLRKDDGEITTLVLDGHSIVRRLGTE